MSTLFVWFILELAAERRISESSLAGNDVEPELWVFKGFDVYVDHEGLGVFIRFTEHPFHNLIYSFDFLTSLQEGTNDRYAASFD